MPKELLLQVTPEVAHDEIQLRSHVSKLLQVSVHEIQHLVVLKRSIDARQRSIKFNLKLSVFMSNEPLILENIQLPPYPDVSNSQEILVVGAGPAGLFAALQLIELGLKPSDHFVKTQLALAMSHGVTLTLCKDDYINLTDQVLNEIFHTKFLNLSSF